MSENLGKLVLYNGIVYQVKDDGIYAFLRAEGDVTFPNKRKVFLHTNDADGYSKLIKGQRYTFNTERGDKGLRAVDAKLDETHMLTGLAKVLERGNAF